MNNGVRERNGKIQIDFYYLGKRYRETLAIPPNPKNMKYAAQLRAAILYDIEKGVFSYEKYFNKPSKESTEVTNNITMKELLLLQLEIYKRRYENGTIAKSTLRGYEKVINNYLIGGIGHYKAQELTPFEIKQWMFTFNHRSKTIRNVLIPLNKALKEAVTDRVIKENPLDNLDVDSVIQDVGKPKQDAIDPFGAEEREILIHNADGQFRNLIQFAFYSGLRTGELIALRWSDVDLNKRLIHVKNNKVYGEEKAPKTKSGIRTILMLNKAYEALIEQQLYTKDINDCVFHNPTTNKPWSSDAKIRYHWLKLFEDKRVRYRYAYQTRHSYASMLLSNGENIAWIATQMGHVNTEMVIRNYGKFIPDSSIRDGYKLKGDY